ncbi:hypothetical protein C9426_24090 [Serratia sp. S1B]|nr:hypothetical protein C9426_24090 [Serratia sp. S1B]
MYINSQQKEYKMDKYQSNTKYDIVLSSMVVKDNKENKWMRILHVMSILSYPLLSVLLVSMVATCLKGGFECDVNSWFYFRILVVILIASNIFVLSYFFIRKEDGKILINLLGGILIVIIMATTFFYIIYSFVTYNYQLPSLNNIIRGVVFTLIMQTFVAISRL